MKTDKPVISIKINSDGIKAWKDGKLEKPEAVKQDLKGFKSTLPKR